MQKAFILKKIGGFKRNESIRMQGSDINPKVVLITLKRCENYL
jgi:hypothetical protein